MSKRAAFAIAGVITSAVVVIVLGLAGSASWSNQSTSTGGTEVVPATATATVYASPADMAALQAQVADYQAALQQANAQLQAAYDEIARLQAQGRYWGEQEENEPGSRFFRGAEDD